MWFFRPVATMTVIVAVVALLCVHVNAFKVHMVSDVHYDPWYGTAKAYGCTDPSSPAYGRGGCDGSPSLLRSLSHDLGSETADLLLYGGDWQRHRFDPNTTTCSQIFDTMSDMLGNTTTPPQQVVGCLGNNDVVPDYEFDWNSTNHPNLRCRVEALHNHSILNDEEKTEMQKCGYYVHDDVARNVSVITLHTLLWTHNIRPAVPDTEKDPCGQFAFLEEQLARAQQMARPVIILSHIPPIMNTYNVISNGKFLNESSDMYWKASFARRYFDDIARYRDVVRMQIFGHTHSFSLLAVPRTEVALMVVPAITRVFANYPSYMTTTISSTWQLQEAQQRYLKDDGIWRDGVSVKGALGLRHGFNNITDMHGALLDMLQNDVTWNNYLLLRGGGEMNMQVFPNGKCEKFCRVVIVCSMVNEEYEGITSCVKNALMPAMPKVTVSESIAVMVVVFCALLSVILFVFSACLTSFLEELRKKYEAETKATEKMPCRTLSESIACECYVEMSE